MRIPYYQVNAFTSKPFGGNPAGVCLLDRWLPDAVLHQLAAENNLSETAFLVSQADGFALRWFTPTVEVDLCGHATLASAFVLFTECGFDRNAIHFHTQSGLLTATRRGAEIELDFPSRPPARGPAPAPLVAGLGLEPREVWRSRDCVALLDSPAAVADLRPNMDRLAELDSLGVIVTARGEDVDFVSRFFAPRAGVPEDPVTGSAHCTLVPFWAERLGKRELVARQLSRRGGLLHCRLLGDRVGIGGRARLYFRGEIETPGA